VTRARASRRPPRPTADRLERARRIQAILDELYPQPPIPLDHGDAFQLLVAVVLSAQCTDARVNLVTPALFARAPDAPTMAAMKPREILRYIRSCGLAPTKAKNLQALSAKLVAEHGGQVPARWEALEALPGVGHKTAGVVMVQAFGVPAFPVDTHIHRLASRWRLSRARNVEETERDLKAVFPEDRWHALHLQFIYFGREHCPARNHEVDACVVCRWAARPGRLEQPWRPRSPTVIPKPPAKPPASRPARSKRASSKRG
jgi:endonuclease-3